MRAALARYARIEPPIDRVVDAAVAASSDDPDRARALAARARLSGLVPSFRLGVRRGRGQDTSARIGDEIHANLSTDDDLALSATATLSLDRLVFTSEEVALLREERAAARSREQLVRAVVSAYYERRRLMLERDLLGRRSADRLARIWELTALLDVFTDGRFRSMMRRSGSRKP
jgi:hypothetical protein